LPILARICYYKSTMKSILKSGLKKLKINKIGADINIFLTFLIIFSALIYYFYALNYPGIVISIFLSIISLIIFKKKGYLAKSNESDFESLEQNAKSDKTAKYDKKDLLILSAWLIFWLAAINELILAQSIRPLISPWEVVSTRFFFFFILNSAILLLLVLKENLSEKIKLILISSHYFLTIAVAVIVYKIGYGFDPFVHEATMKLITEHGFVVPKTPYYLGQYGLIVILHKISGLSLILLNKFLVPVLAAALLPTAIYKFVKKINLKSINKNNSGWLATIITLSLISPLFIVTTPQNLSYIFIILALLSGLSEEKSLRAIIFSLTAAAIHPLAGIPALIWSLWLLLKKYSIKKLLNTHLLNFFISLTTIFLVPLALFFASGKKLNNYQINFELIKNSLHNFFMFGSAGQEDWLLNLSYLLQKNYSLLIIVLIINGLIIFFRKKTEFNHLKNINGLLIIGASLIATFILSSQISFSELIVYEQAGYAKRILVIILLFFGPFVIISFDNLIGKILKDERGTVKIIWSLIALIFISANLYLSYPRFDKYFNSRGYSTSAFDFEAVKLIEKQKTEKYYLVLANQQVSVAALNVFGFNNYYHSPLGLIYFYPIPTGGPLYQYYLQMVYNYPDRETALAAMDLVGFNELYLVINKYWHESDKIIKAAKLTANNWYEIGDQEILIFKYLR